MSKAALAGALVLATVGLSPAQAQEYSGMPRANPAGPAEPAVLTHSAVARFRTALRLTADQERYWPAVGAALRDLIRAQEATARGTVVRAGGGIAGFVSEAVALQRVIAAARPLWRSLDEVQRQEARRLVQVLGFGRLVAIL